MAVPMKVKTNVFVLLIVTLGLLFMMLLFKEVTATGRQRQLMTEKSINVHSSNEVVAAVGGCLTLWQSIETGRLNEHLPNQPPPHRFVAAAEGGSLEPVSNIDVPTCPPCRHEKEQRKKVDGKADLMTSYDTSINGGKHASLLT